MDVNLSIEEIQIIHHALELELIAQAEHRDFVRRYSYSGSWDSTKLLRTENLYTIMDKALEDAKNV